MVVRFHGFVLGKASKAREQRERTAGRVHEEQFSLGKEQREQNRDGRSGSKKELVVYIIG